MTSTKNTKSLLNKGFFRLVACRERALGIS